MKPFSDARKEEQPGGAVQTVSGRRTSRRRWGRRLAAAALAILLIALAGLTWIGVPDFLTRRLVAHVNRGAFFCQVSGVTLDWRAGLVTRDVRIYRKGALGPPFLEARTASFWLHPFAWRSGDPGCIKSVVLERGVLRPSIVSATGRLVPGDGATWDMALRLQQFDVCGTWIEHLDGVLRADQTGGTISRLAGVVGREAQAGAVHGTVSWTWERGLHGQFETAFDPHALVPLCRTFGLTSIRRTLEWFSFASGPPDAELSVMVRAGDPAQVTVKGHVQASDFAYRGAGIAFANVELAYASTGTGRLSLNPLMLVIGGRNVSGRVEIELGGGRIDFETLSTADIPTLARIAGYEGGGLLDTCRFGRGTRVYAKGVVRPDAPEASDVEAYVEGSNLGIGSMVADECSFRFNQKGTTNLLSDIRGKIGGGSFTGSAVLTPVGPVEVPGMRYQVKGEVINVDFQRLRSLWSTNSAGRVDGKLYGSVELSGRTGPNPLASLVGQGYLNMRRGFVFRLPLFGGMTDALASALPGLDIALRQTDVSVPFEILNGRLISDDAQVEGDVLSLSAHGYCRLADGQLAVDVQVRPLKEKGLLGQTVRALTYPVSRLFEFRLDGTIDEPRWRLFNLRRDRRIEGGETGDDKS